MKSLKITVIVNVIILLITIVISSSFRLVKQSDRGSYTCTLTTELKNKIKSEASNLNTEQEIINYSVKTTAAQLTFAYRNDLTKGKANCVGYARMCADICNYVLKLNNIKGNAHPVVGKIHLAGVDIHPIATKLLPKYKNFIKDHDFTQLEINGATYYFDACAYDLINDDCLTEG